MLRFVSRFFIVLLICSQGSLALVQLAHFIHYKEVRSSEWSKNKLRDTISVSREEMKDLVWIKKDEIRYKGRMFDVRNEVVKDGKVLIVGHYDLKDDHLLRVVYTLFDEDSTPGSKERRPVKVLVFEAVFPDKIIYHTYPCEYYRTHNAMYAGSFYQLLPANSFFHPPEVAFA